MTDQRIEPVKPDHLDDAEEEDRVRSVAYRMLSYRWLTVKELTYRLRRRKGIRRKFIKPIVQECIEAGYIDERSLVEDHIHSGREFRLIGRRLIRYNLIRRGVPEVMIDPILDEHYPEEDEEPIARKLVERKLRGMQDVPIIKRYRRIGGMLSRKGFASDVIRTILDEIDWEVE
ncbi:MAG: regulatory protein RecX [Candidatus Electryoneaceae bacterium]|nr:regulatory protein RecX [Candidatus Electryoneaceae bacterium]